MSPKQKNTLNFKLRSQFLLTLIWIIKHFNSLFMSFSQIWAPFNQVSLTSRMKYQFVWTKIWFQLNKLFFTRSFRTFTTRQKKTSSKRRTPLITDPFGLNWSFFFFFCFTSECEKTHSKNCETQRWLHLIYGLLTCTAPTAAHSLKSWVFFSQHS